ncbi:MAG TPA: hypothetical protein VFQ91_23820 [Bryobacteraceae bacterium]|nr:hypothetical protein [Bryobacteraceae bacterium]
MPRGVWFREQPAWREATTAFILSLHASALLTGLCREVTGSQPGLDVTGAAVLVLCALYFYQRGRELRATGKAGHKRASRYLWSGAGISCAAILAVAVDIAQFL